MLNKLPLSAIGMLFLESPGGCAGSPRDGIHAAASALEAPQAGPPHRIAATATFLATRAAESVALAAIWIGVAVLLVVGIAALLVAPAA